MNKSICKYLLVSFTFFVLVSCENGNPSEKSDHPISPEGMKLIIGGTFQMGQTGIAEPVHNCTLSSFHMDTTEITQGRYSELMSSAYSSYANDGYGPSDDSACFAVNWYDALILCRKSGHELSYTF